ncbi:tautomerase family protein [Microvirga sp. W0021]|uniref:Tautomerase family protein n=1 Tax=Hohaiivirga grylli TaxID=3133970 RepID=A0ABV0BH14_9HYPH
MPLVRIDLHKSAPEGLAKIVGDAVYDAMREVANVPAGDKFQIITRHESGELVYPSEGYLGINYSENIIFIQIIWNAGRSVDVKQSFYHLVADTIHAKGNIRKEDIFINLIDIAKENWSFGNGEMQYAPEK